MSESPRAGDAYRPPTATHAPKTSLDFVETLAPIAKYYVILLFFWYLAKRFNAAVDSEASLQDKEIQRPKLSPDLVEDTSDEEEEEDSEDQEDEIYEELVTDGSRLVSVPGVEEQPTVRERKLAKKAGKVDKPKQKVSGKSHPLFEGLKKVEQELKQQRELEKDEEKVSWNELHKGMLNRYKQKYPDHGLRTADGDDYDNEFKDLLKKHNVDISELKKEQ